MAALRENAGDTPAAGGDPALDGWLQSLFDAELSAIDSELGEGGLPQPFRLFRELDDDLWALLLLREYGCYPNIHALLPDYPEPALQEMWNGRSGLDLLTQSKGFYRHVRRVHGTHGARRLADSTVLDFGCGWGRLTRFFARDVDPGRLLGCDPVEEILDVCRASRVPAELARSEFVPERLPFEGPIDLAFSFSVFTHISEQAAETCLRAIHASLAEGGLLVLTIRPPAYLDFDAKMHEARDSLGAEPAVAMREPRYVFVPHPTDGHPQYESGEMTYGEAVISLPYVRERWSELFDLVDVHAFPEDIYQVAVTLKKR